MSGETPQMKLAREKGFSTLEDDEIVFGSNGRPLIQIYCSTSELIPTMKHGNVTCGPVIVKRYVEDDVDLRQEIIKTQTVCEEALAENRQTVHALTKGTRV